MSENKNNNNERKENKTGRYVYDKKLKKVVKVSDEIVGLKKGDSADYSGPSCSSGGCCPSCGLN
jgi:hypothetical protein